MENIELKYEVYCPAMIASGDLGGSFNNMAVKKMRNVSTELNRVQKLIRKIRGNIYKQREYKDDLEWCGYSGSFGQSFRKVSDTSIAPVQVELV